MVKSRTSYTDPLRIDVIGVPEFSGHIGMTICPGKSGESLSFRGEWNRDMASDLAVIKAWDPKAVVTLLEMHEFDELGVSGLPGLVAGSGCEWHHLPIKDGAAPDDFFEVEWSGIGASLLEHLDNGERVLIHCRGGLGRTGTVAAKLLGESGLDPDKAIRTVRRARKGTIETRCQEDYIRGLGRKNLSGNATGRLIEMIGGLKTGDVQNLGSIAVMPLMSDLVGNTDYRTVHQAIELGELEITEIDQSGSVPNLRVHNRGKFPVLMIGGEELTGVKQNRIINTTIVVAASSTLDIPVSCTEQGRWSPSRSGVKASSFMPRSLRLSSKEAIDRTLSYSGVYQGDQGAVWDGISDMFRKSGARSTTGAMKDAMDANRRRVDGGVSEYTPVDGQKGMLVLVDGAVSGMEIVSTENAFRSLCPKMLESYTADLVINGGDQPRRERDLSAAKFLETIAGSSCSTYQSPGGGTDVRFVGEDVSGSALLYQDEIVHLSAYAKSGVR